MNEVASRSAPATALTIAGSDSCGGAGIQADLKTFAAHGVYGASAITAITAQNTLAVMRVHAVPAEIVAAQIDAVLSDLGVGAVKIGMLVSAATVVAVAESLEAQARRGTSPPIVLDPVMVAKSGAILLAPDAVAVLVRLLLPGALIVTPNLPEAEVLAGRRGTPEDLARAIHAFGCRYVLVKGGHAGEETAGGEITDLLFDGSAFERFSAPRLVTRSTHGTGCTLAAAIAANLALGTGLRVAVADALRYTQAAMAAGFAVGGGWQPLDHFHAGIRDAIEPRGK